MAPPASRAEAPDLEASDGVKRSLFFVVAVTLLLALWSRTIERDEERLRASRSRVGHLLTDSERADIPMAALRVETGGKSLLYGRLEGLWRCREYNLAPADSAAIESLFRKLTQAEGMVHTDEVEEAPTYGINSAETIRVFLCGRAVLEDPAGDVLFGFDVGKAIPGHDGAFVRRRGTKEIWAIDSNPRVELTASVAPGLPPLLERGCIPKTWPGWSSGFGQVFVDRPAGGYELYRRDVQIDPAEMKAGAVPWVWILDPGPSEVESASGPSSAYSYFLQQIPYRAVLPREERAQMPLDPPLARVMLAAAEGDPLEVLVGRPLGDGTSPVWIAFTQTLFLVDDEVAELIAPSKSLFAPGSEQNPWDPYLRQAAGGPLSPPSFTSPTPPR